MLNSKPLSKLIFLDLESVPTHASFFDMKDSMQLLFLKKYKKESEDMLDQDADDWDLPEIQKNVEIHPKIEKFYNQRAPVTFEFGKIICITVGWFKEDITTPGMIGDFHTKSFSGPDEKKILSDFYAGMKSVLDKSIAHDRHMVGYRSKAFDFPMIARRMMINKMKLPPFFDTADLKPWQIEHLICLADTMQFGAWGSNTSLALMCELFDVPSSKDAMEGSQVRDQFYVHNNLEGIVHYCEEDVRATGELYLRIKGMYNQITHTR